MRVCVRVIVTGSAVLAGIATLLAGPAPEIHAQGPPQPVAFSHKLHGSVETMAWSPRWRP